MLPANVQRRSSSVPSAAPLGREKEEVVSRRTRQQRKPRVRRSPWIHGLACHLGNEAELRHACVGYFFICLGATNSSLACSCLNIFSKGIPARRFLRFGFILTSHAPPKAHPRLWGQAGPLQRTQKRLARASAPYRLRHPLHQGMSGISMRCARRVCARNARSAA